MQLFNDVEERLQALTASAHAVPGHRKPSQRVGVNRFDLLPQPRQRPPANTAQHIGIDPLAFRAAWPKLALDQALFAGQPPQQRFSDSDAQFSARLGCPV